MLIYLHKNYDHDLMGQTRLKSGKWGSITVTTKRPEECDYLVVINQPVEDIHVKCRKGGRILIIQEPPYSRNSYLVDYFSYFDVIITAFNKKYSSHIDHQPAALPWLINKNFEELVDLFPSENKLDKCSWVTTIKHLYEGHEQRLQFLEAAKHKKNIIDLFGRGVNPLKDKYDGIYPYKYSLAVENYSDKNYWTEKISDVYLSWAMPVYYGCTNLHDFFPENSYIGIDIFKPEEAFEIIEKAVKDKSWDKNKTAIKEARERILNKYQFFPFLEELVTKLKSEAKTNKMMDAFIPLDPNKGGIIKRIKKILNRKET